MCPSEETDMEPSGGATSSCLGGAPCWELSTGGAGTHEDALGPACLAAATELVTRLALASAALSTETHVPPSTLPAGEAGQRRVWAQPFFCLQISPAPK